MTKLGQRSADRKRQNAKLARVIDSARCACGEGPHDPGYMARLLIQATMPHSKPEGLVHQRSNGKLTIRMVGDPDYGLPYGVYPRLLLIHITSEVVRHQSATVELGSSLSAFLTALGLPRTGGPRGSITQLKEQAERLFRSSVSWTYAPNEGRLSERFFPIEADLWWRPLDPSDCDVFQARVRLHARLVEEILAHPIPLDMGTVRTLARTGPFALDVYMWLVQRLFYLRGPLDLTWQQLRLQFGCDYSTLKNFRAAFMRALKPVLRMYPGARVAPSPGGLTLWPSPPHIAPHKRF